MASVTKNSLAPHNASITNPEVRAASTLYPHGRRECWVHFRIDPDIPPRLGFWDNEQLDRPPAATRAAKTNAPILIAVSRENKIAARQSRRKAVSFDNAYAPPWAVLVPVLAHTPPQVGNVLKNGFPTANHAAAFRARFNAGRPRSGSISPRARSGVGETWKVSSAVYSSSHAARLNSVRA
jgi:hypothetical protein